MNPDQLALLAQLSPGTPRQPHSETDFQLGDHQQLKGYFLGGAREPLR